jgi:A/G-specific adenine glycosylase
MSMKTTIKTTGKTSPKTGRKTATQTATPIESRNLIDWYRGIRRDLPWRKDRDPYRIWISEVMLQQTTVVAVIPFYEKFLKRFPTLKDLAISPVEDVLEYWAGLGYYSRARNLHKSSQVLHVNGFPKTAAELLELPGFGPYTARAVSSLAFDEKTGVLDGNVIRILSRKFGRSVEWWKPKGRNELQEIADALAQTEHSADLNQGMMELGATICTPAKPACLLCPWQRSCLARRRGRIA